MAEERERNMSLVPYSALENREIVLRHNDAVVVYDTQSKQLVLRGVSDCPYCHRPFQNSSPPDDRERRGPSPDVAESFVNPDYFRLLHHSTPASTASSPPPSPSRGFARLSGTTSSSRAPPGAEFVGSSPAPTPSSHAISDAAFSQDYFKRFFIEERVLGKGGKGVVLLVRHVLDGVDLGYFACKRVPVGDDHEWLEKVLAEVQLLQQLSHKNLVSYRHVWLEDCKLNNFGPSVPCAFILQQYCNAGDLQGYIYNVSDSQSVRMTRQKLKEQLRRRSKGQSDALENGRLPKRLQFDEIYSFFRDITSGLDHLHSNGYIHRDLKPSNCLLHDTGRELRVLVSDFGEVQVENMARKSTGATGTISYCAPEVLRPEFPGGSLGNFSTKSDVFSLGLILYFMCFGKLPYSNADSVQEEDEDLELLREEIVTWRGFDDERRFRNDLPDKLYEFLRRLLSINPAHRPSTEDILQGIRTGAGLDDEEVSGHSSGNSIFDDMRSKSRISPVDTPSPGPSMDRRPSRQSNTSTPFLGTTSRLRPGRTGSIKAVEEDGTESSELVLRTKRTALAAPSTLPRTPPLLPPASVPSRWSMIPTDFPTITIAKFVLLGLKLVTATSPCMPLATNPWFLYPLLCMSMLDFVAPSSMASTSLLLGLHGLMVWAGAHWAVLCMPKASVWV